LLVSTRYGSCAGSDPWASVYFKGGNGNGTLIYPGLPAQIGGNTPVPLPSIRLKHIRDGMQDFEYLYALKQANQASFAQQQAASFITTAYSFSSDPQALLAARDALGNQLQQLAPSPTIALAALPMPSAPGRSVTFTRP